MFIFGVQLGLRGKDRNWLISSKSIITWQTCTIVHKLFKTASPKTDNFIEYIQRNFSQVRNACVELSSAIVQICQVMIDLLDITQCLSLPMTELNSPSLPYPHPPPFDNDYLIATS